MTWCLLSMSYSEIRLGWEVVEETSNRAVRKTIHSQSMRMTRLSLIGQTFIALSHSAQETCSDLLSTS